MKLSVIIPARDESGCVTGTVSCLLSVLRRESIPREILVVDDGSTDGTAELVEELARHEPDVRLLRNLRNGYGIAVRLGIEHSTGDVLAIFMADASDDPEDLVRCYRKLEEGYECVFGSRFIPGSKVVDYPLHKLLLNRCANLFIKFLFRLRLNDITNAFKCYRREVIEAIEPLISPHFNLTVEMPLKAIIRGYSYAVIPISWTNRRTGISKLKLKEMGSRYLFIVLYLWLEKSLAHGDYYRPNQKQQKALHV